MRRKKILITVHNVFPHEASKLNNFLNRIILRFGDAFIVHNERSKETLSSVYKILRGKIFIVPHGVLQPVAGKRIKETARNYLKIPQDKRVILYFGNIREYKGVDILLKSLRLIKEEMKEVVLLIAGEPWVDWEIYEKIIREDGLEDLVIKRLNFVLPSEIEYYFSASDTVVLPYKYFDSQSGIGALALAFKKPLVVTDVGGLPDFVKDERAIAKPKDAEDLARVITRVLSDEQLLAKLSQDSEGLAEEYGWDGIAQKTTKLYEELLA